MAGTRNHRWIAGLVLVLPLASMLAACGAGDPVAEPARPVLVAQPQPAAGVARGFPGEIRAREESPLAFRVGGELLRREVDVGDRVARGGLVVQRHAGGDVALSVPLAAVQRGDDGAASVWVFEDGRVRAVAIQAGDFGAEQVPVTAGLDAGDWVVVAGGHLLREGQEVSAVDRQNRPVSLSP